MIFIVIVKISFVVLYNIQNPTSCYIYSLRCAHNIMWLVNELAILCPIQSRCLVFEKCAGKDLIFPPRILFIWCYFCSAYGGHCGSYHYLQPSDDCPMIPLPPHFIVLRIANPGNQSVWSWISRWRILWGELSLGKLQSRPCAGGLQICSNIQNSYNKII